MHTCFTHDIHNCIIEKKFYRYNIQPTSIYSFKSLKSGKTTRGAIKKETKVIHAEDGKNEVSEI